MKKALGLRSSSSSGLSPGSGVGSPSPGKGKRPLTIGELIKAQMGVSENNDSRIRRALLRIAAGQVGKRIESMVLPLELLQQFIEGAANNSWRLGKANRDWEEQ